MARELPRWFYFLIPFYAIQEIIYTFTPIYILHLGGNVVDVGIAVALYSIAYMPASIIGGKLADTLGKRRSLALLGLTFQAVSLVGMSLLRSIYSIEGFFTLYSFGYSITIPIVGLLVMETLPKEKWGEGNSISFRFMIIGYILGLGPAIAFLLYLPFYDFFIIPFLFLIVGFLFAVRLIKEPMVTFERRTQISNFSGFIERLSKYPVLFLRLPKLLDFKAIYRSSKNSMTRDLPVIMLSAGLFFFASNLLFTSYTPFLYSNNISFGLIMLSSLYLTIINYIGTVRPIKAPAEKGDVKFIVNMIMVRALGALSAALLAAYIFGFNTLLYTFVIYSVLGMAYTPIFIGMNSLLYYRLPSGGRGGMLGVYSAISSLSLFFGSYLSGLISFYLGYFMTYFLAAIFFFIAAISIEWHFKSHTPDDKEISLSI